MGKKALKAIPSPQYVHMYVNTQEISVLCVDISTYLKNLH